MVLFCGAHLGKAVTTSLWFIGVPALAGILAPGKETILHFLNIISITSLFKCSTFLQYHGPGVWLHFWPTFIGWAVFGQSDWIGLHVLLALVWRKHSRLSCWSWCLLEMRRPLVNVRSLVMCQGSVYTRSEIRGYNREQLLSEHRKNTEMWLTTVRHNIFQQIYSEKQKEENEQMHWELRLF